MHKKKTILLYSEKFTHNKASLAINATAIDQVQVRTFLCVWIDSKLSWVPNFFKC